MATDLVYNYGKYGKENHAAYFNIDGKGTSS